MYLTLFVGVLCWSLFGMHCFMSILVFAIILTRKRELVAFIVFLMFCYCKRSVTLPQGVVDWSAVCDCGIS